MGASSTSFDPIFSKLDICQGSINNARNFLNGILEGKKIEQLNTADLKKISPSLLKEAKAERRTYIKNAVIASIIALSLIGLSSLYFISMQIALPYAIGASFSLVFLGYLASFIKKINLFVFYRLSFHKQNAMALCLIESCLKEIVKNTPEKVLPPSPPERSQRLETPSSASTMSVQTSQVCTQSSSSSSSQTAAAVSSSASTVSVQTSQVCTQSSSSNSSQTAAVVSSSAVSISSSSTSVKSSSDETPSSSRVVVVTPSESPVSSSSTTSVKSSSDETPSSSRVVVVTPSESPVSSSSVSVASSSSTQLASGSAPANAPSVKWITEAQRKAFDNLSGNEKDKENVRKLFKDIAELSLLTSYKIVLSIIPLGIKIRHVHPFKFFSWVFSDKDSKGHFKTMRNDEWKWGLAKDAFLEQINKHPDVNTLSTHLDVFVNDTFGLALDDPKKLEQLQVHKLEQLQLIKAELEPYFDLNKWIMNGKEEETFGTKKWEEFVDYLIANC